MALDILLGGFFFGCFQMSFKFPLDRIDPTPPPSSRNEKHQNNHIMTQIQ